MGRYRNCVTMEDESHKHQKSHQHILTHVEIGKIDRRREVVTALAAVQLLDQPFFLG
jgi:hypothetical protein